MTVAPALDPSLDLPSETAVANLRQVSDTDVSDATGDEEPSSQFSGVHDVLKSVDYWFEREVYQLEREADRAAAEMAHENLPTLTQADQDQLPTEKVLAELCAELWQRWPQRIQVKMQDAIDAAATELSSAVSTARAAITEMRLERAKLEDAGEKIEDIRREMALEQGPVRYRAFMSAWTAGAFAVLLIAVEFIANQAVFRVIWPMQPGIQASLSEAIADSPMDGWFSGLTIAAREALGFFEASLLAAVVVILLYVLAKSLGVALRPLVALRPKDYPYASRSIESLHRQKYVVGFVSILGTVAVLVFLYQSRGSAERLVASRFTEAQTLERQLAARVDSIVASGGIASSALNMRVATAQAEVQRLERELAFAQTIVQNNLSILILNISLVAFALVVGFMRDERDISDTMGEHPDLPRLKEKCLQHKSALITLATEAKERISVGERAGSRLRALLRSQPLATLPAKRARLQSIIPRWRATNARLRGLDPVSIAAFRKPIELTLPEIEGRFEMVKPDSVDQHRSELDVLSAQLYSVELHAEGPESATV